MGAREARTSRASRSSWSARRCWHWVPTASPVPSRGPAAGGCRRSTPRAVVHAPAPPLRPLADAVSRDMAKDWDRNYVHSLDWRWLTKPLTDGPGESWLKPDRRPRQGRDHDAARAAVRGGRRRQRHRHQARHRQVDVHEHRPRGARAPDTRGRVDRHPRRDQLRARRHRHHVRHAVRRDRRGRRDPAVGAGASAPAHAEASASPARRRAAAGHCVTACCIRSRSDSGRSSSWISTVPSSCTSNTSSAIDSQMPCPVHLSRSTSTRMVTPILLLDMRRQAFDAVDEAAVQQVGLAELDGLQPSQQLAEQVSQLGSWPAGCRGRSAARHRRSRGAGWASGAGRMRRERRRRSRRGWPNSRTARPCRRPRSCCPSISVSSVANRANCITGDDHRTNSSTAEPIRFSKSAISQSR